jgi:hypothetical protein
MEFNTKYEEKTLKIKTRNEGTLLVLALRRPSICAKDK